MIIITWVRHGNKPYGNLASRLNLYFNIGVCVCVCVCVINCKIQERIKLLLLLLLSSC